MAQIETLPILWVDDDVFFMQKLVGYVRDAGFEVVTVMGPDEALSFLQQVDGLISMALIDIMMPHGTSFTAVETLGGYRTGLELARRIKKSWPRVPVVAFSVAADLETEDWFHSQGDGFIVKPARIAEVLKVIRRSTGQVDTVDGPRCFIVHGHDDMMLLQLKNYLQNTLRFSEPVILREQSSHGRTIIEKFEELSDDVDFVFVLMTPDDETVTAEGLAKRQSRQNVVFELGFFYGKLQRRSGRIFLLHKGSLEIPSDVAGIVYIDVNDGIESAGEQIRKELGPLLE